MSRGWNQSAKRGATGLTYEIRTIEDFLKVPASRRRICLREFDAWLHMREAIPKLIQASARALGGALPPEAFRFKDSDVFRWRDDGAATITVDLSTVASDGVAP